MNGLLIYKSRAGRVERVVARPLDLDKAFNAIVEMEKIYASNIQESIKELKPRKIVEDMEVKK